MEEQKFSYWYFQDALPHHVCDDIIKRASEHKAQLGITGKQQQNPSQKINKKDLFKKRNSEVVWLDELWIYNHVTPYIHAANRNAGWNYHLETPEHTQFTKYGPNQHYGWHQDCEIQLKPNKNHRIDYYNGKMRKLSMTCLLNDPSEYKGGEFEFDYRNYDPDKRNKKQHESVVTEATSKGSILVFPSYLWHRVKPITKGIRYSLVVWMLGNEWQ